MSFSLSGKLALITGGGTGLGLGMAQCFVAAGAQVVITGRRQEPLEAACQALGPQAHFQVMDVTDKARIPGWIKDIENRLGPLDVLVNNAGINKKISSLEMTDADFAQILDTNLHSVFALTREVARQMLPRGQGSIIMISSMAAIYGLANVAAYGASKAAVAGMTRILASEYSPQGVRVNSIAPGFIDTPMLRKAIEGDDARRAKILGRTPMNHFGQPDDIGWAAVYLASDAARYVTGTLLPVDGGNSIGF
jgi:NAD(P)-dependent dehydrogenase (short-subunit alcohol dehydrogenase family)